MSDVATKTVDQQLVKKTHPVRGVLWGLMMGLGLSIVLVLTKVIPFALAPMLIVLVLGTVIGTVWSIFGPAKHAKDVPTARVQSTGAKVDTAVPVVDEAQPADTPDAVSPDQPASEEN